MFQRFKRKEKSEKTPFYNAKLENSELELTTSNMKKLLCGSSDIVFRELYINGDRDLPLSMIYIDGLIDTKIVDDDIMKPLLQEMALSKSKSHGDIISKIEHGTLYHAGQFTRDKLSDCIGDIFNGCVALVLDKDKKAMTFEVKGHEKRSITEPTSENVNKGAKDAFIESIRTNTATVRNKIRTHNLVIRELRVGEQSKTKVVVVYINGITNMDIANELIKRLNNIKTEGVTSPGVIEEGIIDNKNSPFPQVIYTERTDKFCANVLEGRVGLLIDGFPAAYCVPGTFEVFMQAPEDYSQNYIISSVIRTLRFIITFVTLFLPGFYAAVTTFHQEMIPTELALAITASKEGVPFPSFVEVIFMLTAFEILIEAGLRLPKSIGQAVSIVGAVVVGQAAIDARLVSPAVVVVVSLTAISSFAMPNQDFSNALRLWRFLFVILSSVIGLFGLSIGGIILLSHLSNMEVYGIPYMSPFAGEDNKQMQDAVFRLPFSKQYKRPIGLKTKNKKREN